MSQYDNIRDIYSTLITKEFKTINNIIDKACETSMLGIKEKMVLDVPCGDGKYSQLMLDMGANGIVGIDISEEMIRTCKNRILSEKARFFCGNIAYFDLSKIKDFSGMPQMYDAIFAFALWHYLPDLISLDCAVKNLTSHLKRNGILYSLVLDSDNIPCESNILNVWSNSDKKDGLDDGDKISWNYLLNGKWMFPKNIGSYFWKNETLRMIFKFNMLNKGYEYNLLDKLPNLYLSSDEETSLQVWSMWKYIKY